MSQSRLRTGTLSLAIAAAVAVAGCGQHEAATGTTSEASNATPAPASGAPSSTPLTPAPGKHVIVVELHSDSARNYFQPSAIKAARGDVIRYTLATGVHNVHFLPDSNPGKTGLPSASDLLQLPGQTVDIPVTFAPGAYYFQCDPHAALGMKGHLTVTP